MCPASTGEEASRQKVRRRYNKVSEVSEKMLRQARLAGESDELLNSLHDRFCLLLFMQARELPMRGSGGEGATSVLS